MSEVTEKVRKMLAQAQVFARDTPFEAVSRARQAIQVVDEAIAAGAAAERAPLTGLRKIAVGRLAKYEAQLEGWLAEARTRSHDFDERERARLALPLRAKV